MLEAYEPKMSIAHPKWTLFYQIKLMQFESPTCKMNTMNQKISLDRMTIQHIMYSVYDSRQPHVLFSDLFGHCIQHFM